MKGLWTKYQVEMAKLAKKMTNIPGNPPGAPERISGPTQTDRQKSAITNLNATRVLSRNRKNYLGVVPK